MHIKRSVIDKSVQQTGPPFVIPPEGNGSVIDDSKTGDAIVVDTETEFIGQSNPRAIQWLIDEVKKLIG